MNSKMIIVNVLLAVSSVANVQAIIHLKNIHPSIKLLTCIIVLLLAYLCTFLINHKLGK